MPKSICNYNGCNKIINGREKYCEEHKKLYGEGLKEKHRHYKRYRKDKREQTFYNSKQWKMVRNFIAVKYKGLCVWSYYEESIVQADVYHHIVPIKDDWDRRLDIYNIIPLSSRAHNIIHEMYKKDKKGTQKILMDLIWKWNKVGGK